ncbi:MAG: crossover junction endodeoxyribonuclease RuvC [Chloroflexota bacterium]
MRVLGVDPGLVRTGWAVVESEGEAYRLLASGIIAPPANGELGQRLDFGFEAITKVLSDWRAGLVALEELFSNPHHPTASLRMAHMRGVLCLAMERASVPVRHYTATTVKQRLTGSGHASKEQIRRMVFQLCELPPVKVRLDLTDAIALAITALTEERTFGESSSLTTGSLQALLGSGRGRRAAVFELIAEQYPNIRTKTS